jgi:hypothetical protein
MEVHAAFLTKAAPADRPTPEATAATKLQIHPIQPAKEVEMDELSSLGESHFCKFAL